MTSVGYGLLNVIGKSKQYHDQPTACVWVPLYHDYGLICRMMFLFSGIEMYTLDPVVYLRNPVIWVEAINKFKCNMTIGPNFSYQLTCRKLKEQNLSFDLSCLDHVDIAAEPIHETTPDLIQKHWGAPLRSIKHSYGFAETCVWASTIDSYFDPETKVAASGSLEESNAFGMDFIIADKETCKLLPDGVTGDVFGQGPGIVKGYWNNSEASKAFHFVIDGKKGEWYLTGDLGYIKDGKLFLTGRSKDVIIVNGKNIYATDIERTVEEEFRKSLRQGCSAAFQVGDDEAVIICEIRPGEETNLTPEALISMKKSIENEFGLRMRDILCVAKGSVPKTTSGKIRRSEAKRMYLEGCFTSQMSLEDQILCDSFSQLLRKYDVLEMDKTLFENGVDSLKLTRLIEDAQLQFGIHIDFDMAGTVPCSELENHASMQKKHTPLPNNFPTYPTIQDSRMRLWLPIQLLSVLLLVALVSICVFPAVYVYEQFDRISPVYLRNLGRNGFAIGGGIAVVVWMLTYSIIVLLAKWIVIGRYQPTTTAIWSSKFFAWWFVDRLVNIWELTIGGIILDTPLLNAYYALLGCKNDIATTRFCAFVREFDLFEADKRTTVGSQLRCASISTQGLLTGPVKIMEGTKVMPYTFSYPGDKFSSNPEEPYNPSDCELYEDMSISTKVQRVIFPVLMLCLSTLGPYWGSLLNQLLPENPVLGTLKPLFILLGFHFTLLFSSAILCRIDAVSFTADRLGNIGFGFLPTVLSTNTNLINVVHQVLYGTNVSLSAQLNSFGSIAPSQGRYVTIKGDSSISTSVIRASQKQPVLIEDGCTVGIFAMLEKGVTMKKNSAVGVLCRVPKSTVVSENYSFMPGQLIPSPNTSSTRSRNGLIWKPWVVKLFLVWPYYVGLGYAIALAMIHLSQSLGPMPNALKTTVMLFFSLLSFMVGIQWTSICSVWLFSPRRTDKRLQIDADSFKASLYAIALAHSYFIRAFVHPFITGTIIYPWTEKLSGAKIKDCSKVLMMGRTFDPNWLEIQTREADVYSFVADHDSLFEAHRLQYGQLILERAVASPGVTLHTGAVVMGQKLGTNVTLAKGSKVAFSNRINGAGSGIFYGNPAVECSSQTS
jgi:acyl carrier protein